MSTTDLIALAAALCLLVAPLSLAGLALMNAGFARSRAAAHAVLSALVATASAAIGFLVLGCAFFGAPSHHITVHGTPWGVIGSAHTFLRGVDFHSLNASLTAGFLLFAAALVAVIPLGTGTDRWRFYPMALSSALVAALPFAIFAHWIWGGGWLSQLGAIDAGGSSAIAAVGGLSALSITWLLGPRQGKYDDGGMALPGHNMVMVLFGCLLTLPVGSASPRPRRYSLARLRLRPSRSSRPTRCSEPLPDCSPLSGSLARATARPMHLCAPTASSPAWSPSEPVATSSSPWRPLPSDSPSAWFCPSASNASTALASTIPAAPSRSSDSADLWGTFAAGAVAQGHPAQWLAQLAVISALLGMVLPITHLLHFIVNRFSPQRVSAEGEQMGMDMHELGAGAYPELQQVMKDQFHR